ncbi:hypothetical protein LH128_00085 [Sphingomonas sp. LH128]|uniref:hypothetical protein n=1 Tax=Sphingomonas sp. LH128 TaxID=473781 RepID=UPI00027CB13C|nr:hypothetical protein [Sphingomonas sp. LH128]EJU15134.1 hypothetical protein LH128_00085 [Sphingomonas sp. LH128]
MSDLLELAARCEAATRLGEASAILAAHDAMFPEPPSNYQPRATPSFSVEWSEWSKRMCAVRNFVQVGAHIDAAMMLVPDGWRSYSTDMSIQGRTRWMLVGPKTKWIEGLDGLLEAGDDWYQQAVAATPPLALTAACLRARNTLPTAAPAGSSSSPASLHSLGTGAAEATGGGK